MITTTHPMEMLYCDWCIGDVFFPFTIEVFRCLHQQTNKFFIDVLTWHGQQRVLKAFLCWYCIQIYKQRMSIVLQKSQVIYIFKQSIDVGEAFFRLMFFQSPHLSPCLIYL